MTNDDRGPDHEAAGDVPATEDEAADERRAEEIERLAAVAERAAGRLARAREEVESRP